MIQSKSPDNKLQRMKDQKGHTVVEMSLLLLPFFILILGVIEFGWYFLHQHTLQYATREGMRMGIVGTTLVDEQGTPLTRAESIEKLIQEKAKLASMDIPEGDINFYTDEHANNYEYTGELAWEDLAPNAGNPADYVRLKVKYEHKFLVPIFAAFFKDSPTDDPTIWMYSEATYRNELFEEEV